MAPTPDDQRAFFAKPWVRDLARRGLGTGPLKLSGPLVRSCVAEYARKLITALHYKEFGKIIPASGGIIYRWYSNVQKIEGKTPDELLPLMTGQPVLRRGRKNLSDQFSYQYVAAEDGELTGYFAMFRQSFAILGFVHPDIAQLDFVTDDTMVLRPLVGTHSETP